MRRTALLVSLTPVLACFSPERSAPLTSDGSDDTAGSQDTSAEGPSTTLTSTSQTTDSVTVTDASMSSTAPTTTMTGDPDTTTAETEVGPRIVMSVPADGDANAPLDGYFFLYFDRVVSTNDAVGRIHVSQNGSAPQPISPMPCPPDADPTCIAGIFPASFVDEETNNLPGAASHTITVDADFPDPDGLVNTMDQVVAFTTFAYESNFFDDSAAIAQESGGVAYDPGSESLFMVGIPPNFGDECVVRRIPIPGGNPGAASTAATPTNSYLCYGIDVIGTELYVSGSYTDNVFRYSNLANANLDPSEFVFSNPTLPPPLADLSEVFSVARGGGGLFFSHGEFTGGIEDTSILRRTDAGVWSEFESGANLWEDTNGVVIEGASFNGVDHLIVGANDELFKFRVADGTIISQSEFELGYSFDLHVDSAGRLWVGGQDGLTVLEVADDSYTVLATRPGLEADRFALREDGNTVHVYFQRFRSEGTLGHLSVEL